MDLNICQNRISLGNIDDFRTELVLSTLRTDLVSSIEICVEICSEKFVSQPFVYRVVFAVVLAHPEVEKKSYTITIGTKRKSDRAVNTPKGEAQPAWWEGTQKI